MNARLPVRPLAIAAIGAVCLVVGYVVDAPRTASAYLVAYAACLSVALGALALVMIARVTAATWFVAVRRQAEQVAATLPAFAILLIPILVSIPALYSWANPDILPADTRSAVLVKAAYLNTPFFVVRAVIYVIAWAALGELLRRASLAQDRRTSPSLERRMYVTSAVGLVVFAFSTSFAAFDWFMSLSPAWYSTIYGVNFFAGGMVGALALLAMLVARGHRTGDLSDAIGANHFHALAKLLLTFVLFWVYIGFAQLIVIWSAEIPVERAWYALRMRGGWFALGAVVLFGHFVLPFCALVVQRIKRSAAVMPLIGAWLLVMHYLDSYWVVMPDAHFHAGWSFIVDAGAVLFVGGVAAATWAVRRAGEPAIPVGDERLAASLQYTTD